MPRTTKNMSRPDNDDDDDDDRRPAYMMYIVNGLPKCVHLEHIQLYRTIIEAQPDAPMTQNQNGVFVPLRGLDTAVLMQCYDLVRHGLAQGRKERRRISEQNTIRENMS